MLQLSSFLLLLCAPLSHSRSSKGSTIRLSFHNKHSRFQFEGFIDTENFCLWLLAFIFFLLQPDKQQCFTYEMLPHWCCNAVFSADGQESFGEVENPCYWCWGWLDVCSVCEIDCTEMYLLHRWYQYSCHKQDCFQLVWLLSAANPLERKPAWSEIPPIKHKNMSSGHFFQADWFLQYLSNPAQASWADLLHGLSGKTCYTEGVVVQDLDRLQNTIWIHYSLELLQSSGALPEPLLWNQCFLSETHVSHRAIKAVMFLFLQIPFVQAFHRLNTSYAQSWNNQKAKCKG